MKKVLVITYYWPPSGGAGVQRWLKFAKYLREYGWEPVIYTPENPESPADDNSLLKDVPEGLEVVRTRIWEPYSAYKKFVGRKRSDRIKTGFLTENKKPSFAEKLAVWIRGNLFIPDARKHWIKPSIRFLESYLQEHPVDAIVSTGPPHSMHLIALGLKEKTGLPWLADFRDPWTNIDFYKELKLTRKSDRKHRKQEQSVLKEADRVVVIGQGMVQDFRKIVPRDYVVITNGFDAPAPTPEIDLPMDRFSLAHIGSMVPSRNPEALWQALRELCDENPEFKSKLEIRLAGQVDHSVRSSISRYGLDNYLTLIDYLTYDEVILAQQKASVLLLLINNSPNARLVVTGKLFEYMRSGRPVLCVGPTEGDASHILSETNTGITVDPADTKGLKMVLLSYFVRFKNNELLAEGQGIEKYSRRNLTGQLVDVLNAVING